MTDANWIFTPRGRIFPHSRLIIYKILLALALANYALRARESTDSTLRRLKNKSRMIYVRLKGDDSLSFTVTKYQINVYIFGCRAKR